MISLPDSTVFSSAAAVSAAVVAAAVVSAAVAAGASVVVLVVLLLPDVYKRQRPICAERFLPRAATPPGRR